jgi:3-oxoacyl-[acyl-carrier protein] reductase
MRLKEKVAVITGGTKGLGRAVAQRFLDEGASVVCAARTPGDSAVLIRQARDRAVYHEVDVTDPASVADAMDVAIRTYGGLDILVANAGVNHDGKVEHLRPEQWKHMVDTNLNGVFYSTQAAAKHMVRQGSGRIITVSSCMATRVAIGAAGYAATKAAVEMFTKTAAIELGRKGVQVNCVAPGVLDGGMGSAVAGNEALWNAYRPRFALGRAGRLDEAADAAVFLACDESSYVNGHVLEVNGGLLWA